MLEAVNLTKRYEDGHLALDHLNLQVSPGEIFCLLGANGAGKTTTINLFLNLIPPTFGHALVDGIDSNAEPLRAKARVAYVSENVMLYGALTARQNLRFFTELAGRQVTIGRAARESDAIDIDGLLRRVGLPERSFGQRVSGFSKGMRQKLGIAVAISKQAPVMLLDEPTSGLDPKAAEEFIEILVSLREEGKTILMSTHDIFRARQLTDKIGIMKDGNLVVVLSQDELEASNLSDLYLDVMGV